jgi:hypothetical protein
MLGKLIRWRTLRRMKCMVAVDNLLDDTDGVAAEVSLAWQGSGHGALCHLADQQ